MLNEFYKYIANNTIGFFQEKAGIIRPGERYCLRLDTAEMVEGVDEAIRERTATDQIQGFFKYGNVYETFTIRLSADMEVVVAAKINGMTDDFLATLRNATLTDKHFPILMITHSPIDTITSGTGDLAANGMPFHAESIISKIKSNIKTAELSPADRALLELELERKQNDRFSDKSSLFEYKEFLTILGRGSVLDDDFAAFSLLKDDTLSITPPDKIRGRLLENHQLFDHIDWTVRHGNIEEELGKEYDSSFIKQLVDAKKQNLPWYENFTFNSVKSSRDKWDRITGNPLFIDTNSITAFSDSPLEYTFEMNEKLFVRDDGSSKAKQRQKNVIIWLICTEGGRIIAVPSAR